MLRLVNSNYFDGDTEEMLRQLQDMISKDMQTQRLEQINICMEMKQYFQGAQALLTLKEMFNLESGFAEIERLVQLVRECSFEKICSAIFYCEFHWSVSYYNA